MKTKTILSFLIVLILLKVVLPQIHRMEFFDNPDTRVNPPCPPNSVATHTGDCKLAQDIYGLPA